MTTEPTGVGPSPCPFCGSSNVGHYEVAGRANHHFECCECFATSRCTATHQEALAAWNRRTPQPTHAQAGAVPLTDEQLLLLRFATSSLFHLFERWGKKEIPHRQLMDEMQQVIEHVIRRTVAAHGIKGGQHD